MGAIRTLKYIYDFHTVSGSNYASIKHIQKRRLLRLVRFAKQNSAFYADLYRNINIDKDMHIDNLPLIDKKTFMDNLDSILTVKDITKNQLIDFCNREEDSFKINSKYTVIHSSGTSGLLWISVFDDSCFDYEIASKISYKNYELIRHIFRKRPRMACVFTDNPHVGSTVFYKSIPRFLAEVRHFSVRKPISVIVKELNEFNPYMLLGYPSVLSILAEQKLKNILHISPKKVFWGGFMPTEEMKKSVIEAFNCVPYSGYFATEATGPIAAECKFHSLHVYSQALVLEVLDTNDNPVPAGKPGKAVITNLMNFVQPIIRYRLNDIVQMSTTKCPCGSTLPVIEKILGREGDIVWVDKGNGDYEVLDPILFNFKIPGLEKFQVIQEENAFLKVKAVVNEREQEVTEQIEEAMDNILKDKGLLQIVRVKVEVVSDIPLVLNKHKMVISKFAKTDIDKVREVSAIDDKEKSSGWVR